MKKIVNLVRHLLRGVSVLDLQYNGRVVECFVDTKDYDKIKDFGWRGFKSKGSRVIYAVATTRKPDGSRTSVLMHSLLMSGCEHVDHKDFNGLNNRRSNLRHLDASDSTVHTRKKRGTASKFRGVRPDKRRNLWYASIRYRQEEYWLGSFVDESDAARAYDKVARSLHGKLANLNFPEEK